MQKIGDSTTTASADGEFIEGSPAAGVDATLIRSEWLNTIQRELIAVVLAGGLTLDPDKDDQLLRAIRNIHQTGAGTYAVDSGSANAYVFGLSPALSVRQEAVPIRLKVKTDNTGASTINDGLGVVPLVGKAYTALQRGEMRAGGFAWIVWSGAVGSGSYVLLFCTGAPEQVAPASQSQHAAQFGQLSGVVATCRNARMVLPAISVSATFTADELIVETALGGLQYRLASFSKTVSLAITGAGGMDTGSAPASSFVGLYAIYNPTTQTSAMLAVSAAGVVLPSVYGGANMPAGFTASALVSVWPTNASGALVSGYQADRTVSIPAVTALSTSAITGSQSPLSITSAVPLNAKFISGYLTVSSSALASLSLTLYPSTTTPGGAQSFAWGAVPAGAAQMNGFSSVQVVSPGLIGYVTGSSAGTPSFQININAYTF